MRNVAAEIGPATLNWWQDWRGQSAALVASGPSAKHLGVDKLRGRLKVIAVNDSYKLAPWADALYACDCAWWQLHKGVADFAGLKFTHDRVAAQHFKDLHRVEIEHPAGDDLMLERPSYIGAGGNSGFQAFNLLIQFGCTRIALVGVDCSLDAGAHWHGRHPQPLSNPAESNMMRWRKSFDGAASRLLALGIEVVNCSPSSALTAYPKLSIDEALRKWQI